MVAFSTTSLFSEEHSGLSQKKQWETCVVPAVYPWAEGLWWGWGKGEERRQAAK